LFSLHKCQKNLRVVADQPVGHMAAGRDLVEHKTATAREVVNHAERVVLVGNVLRGSGIHDEIELGFKPRGDAISIEIKRGAVAMSVIVDRGVFDAERLPECGRRGSGIGLVLETVDEALILRRAQEDLGTIEQPIDL
jgi:hypothetical protein